MRLFRINDDVINVDQIASIVAWEEDETRIYLSNAADEFYEITEPLDKVIKRIRTDSFEV